MELSKFIREWRTSHGMTMQEFADKAGLSKGFISQIENDFRNNKTNKKMTPSLANVKKLAFACDMSVSDFLNTVDTEISLIKEDPDDDPQQMRPVFPDFKTPQEAVRFLLEQPLIADFGGYDIDAMSDEEIIAFANEIAGMIQFAATHHYAKRKE